jgi:hypothetical protein
MGESPPNRTLGAGSGLASPAAAAERELPVRAEIGRKITTPEEAAMLFELPQIVSARTRRGVDRASRLSAC